MSARLVLTTDQLRLGDVVLHHGMRVLLDTEPTTWEVIYTVDGKPITVYSWRGLVQNPDDVKADRMLWSFLHEDVWHEGTGWVHEFTGRYSIQGNHFAHWNVERAAVPA